MRLVHYIAYLPSYSKKRLVGETQFHFNCKVDGLGGLAPREVDGLKVLLASEHNVVENRIILCDVMDLAPDVNERQTRKPELSEEVKNILYRGVLSIAYYRSIHHPGNLVGGPFIPAAKKLIGDDFPEIFTEEWLKDWSEE
jgi:hypothetical protein